MKQTESTNDCYLDLKRLSERSCLSIRTLRSRIKGENSIPIHRVGQKILVRWCDFVFWMEGYREPVKSAPVDSEIQTKVDKIITDLT